MKLKVLWTTTNSLGAVSDLKMLMQVKGFNIDVVTADASEKDLPGFVFSKNKHTLPLGSSSYYIENVLELCRKEAVNTIIPQYGDELVPLSRNLKQFEGMGVKVLVTEDTLMLETANNKKALYDFFKDRKFIPYYGTAKSIDEIEKVIYKIGYPYIPICMKPVSGEGSRGFMILTEEKVNIFNEPPGRTRISWRILKEQLLDMGSTPEILIVEYLPGSEYSVDCICKDGETLICIPRQRVETSVGVATVSLIERNDVIFEISREVIKKLNLSYNINLQFKYSIAGQPKLVEVNPRVSGSLISNLGAGVNMLEMALKTAYGIPLGNVDIKWGTKMLRYYDQYFI